MARSFVYRELSSNVIDFCALLRLEGFLIGPAEVQDALKALLHTNLQHQDEVKHSLSMVLCSSQSQLAIFDVMFRAYFLPAPSKERPPESQAKATEGGGEESKEAPQVRKKQAHRPKEATSLVASEAGTVQDSSDEDAEAGSPISLKAFFSPFASKFQEDLVLSSEDKDTMTEAARLLVNKVRLGKTRRWRAMTHGPRFHFRRTLRKALTTGGEALKPAWLGHPPRKPHFVLLLDSSRSMSSYSERLLQFARALSQRSSRVEVYLFSTSLKRISKEVRRARQATGLSISDLGEAYGGGTKIGHALTDFVRRYGQGNLNPDTLVLIASDGLDTGKPELLARAMREMHRRSGGVVWLNPLIDTPGYQPTAAGMQAALPYIDTFCTVKDALSFERLSSQVKLRR